MHSVTIRQEVRDRVMARRGRYHLFDALDPRRTALVIIDMQGTFVAEGAPAEVPAARGIVGNINELADAVRALGVTVIWVTHANRMIDGGSDWNMMFDNIVAAEVKARTIASLDPDGEGQKVWHELKREPGDLHVVKNRYSALIAGSSQLERILRGRGFDTILVGGTKTNICCEATARDAMMLDFKVVMVEDCNAALSDDEHRSALENIIQNFGDVMTSDEVIAALKRMSNA